MPILKVGDSAVLREKPAISPGKVSTSQSTLPSILKIKISRDTKLTILRELRKGNLLSAWEKGAKQALIWNLGRRFLT